jgi:thymidylate synthase
VKVEIVGTSAGDVFLKSLRAVLANGSPVSPRLQPTRELTGVQLRILNPRARLVGPETGRRINPAFAVAEALWILGGSDDPWIHEYNSQLHQFVGEGSPPGAYGPRVRSWGPNGIDQLLGAYQCLVDDPQSRRAVIQVFDPAIDPGTGIDVPCTLSYRFLARGDKLHMFVTMRSQDVWLGLPYDTFSATVIMEVLASWLEIGVGECTFSMDSFHLYERDIAKTAATTGRVSNDHEALRTLSALPSELGQTIEHVLTDSAGLAEGWQDAARILASYRLAKTDVNAGIEMARAVAGPLGEAAVGLYRFRGDRS